MSNTLNRLGAVLNKQQRTIVTVIAANPNGTSTVEFTDGSRTTALGDTITSGKAYLENGRVVAAAPDLPFFDIFTLENAVPAAVLTKYDTVIGVGDSITQGEFDLNLQFEAPFRGVNFKSAAQYGAELQQIIDRVANFTSLASGKTLFIVRAGINDCNAYLAAGGVSDGATGNITAYNTLSNALKTRFENEYRTLIAELKQHGDVALASITYCDAKGQLSVMPDKGRNLHCGSWNDDLVVPLCQELTPEFFNSSTGRPTFDYYNLVHNDPSILDDDNLHFYNDHGVVMPSLDLSVVNPRNGSATLRNYTIEQMLKVTAMDKTPFDDALYKNRVLINLTEQRGVDNFKSYATWANNVIAHSGDAAFNASGNAIKSFDDTKLDAAITLDFDYSDATWSSYNRRFPNQPYSEGITDRNLCSSGVMTGYSRVHDFVINNAGKGKISLIGFGWFSNRDSVQTQYSIVDDNGEQVGRAINNYFDDATESLADRVVEFDYDCTVSKTLRIKLRKATGGTYAVLSGIQLDIAK